METEAASNEQSHSERRADRRHLAVLQIGKLILRDRQALCLVRNISAGGVMVQSTTPLRADDPIAIQLKASDAIPGRIAWVKELSAGISFNAPIDVDHVLLPDPESTILPRQPRLEVTANAKLTAGRDEHAVELWDISQGGAKIAWSGALFEEKVELAVEGLPARAGRMCWTKNGFAGIAFNLALPFDVLADWVLSRSPRITLSDLA